MWGIVYFLCKVVEEKIKQNAPCACGASYSRERYIEEENKLIKRRGSYKRFS